MRIFLTGLFLLAAAPVLGAVPVYKWFPSNEFYFAAPFAQDLHYAAGNKTSRAGAWALGFRGVGNGEGVGKTGGLQLQQLTVSDSAPGVNGSFYLLEFLAGAEYISPKKENKELRFTTALLADLGLADSTLFAAPVLTAGLLYQADPAQAPGGFNLSLYYRFANIPLDNAAGRPAALRPALGLKLGYIFPGFWSRKQ